MANADQFLRGAKEALQRHRDNETCHALAIALELALKAYLLDCATDDAWNRRHIRRDLSRAVRYAERAGLRVPDEIDGVVPLLHPHFANGGFHRLPDRDWPSGFPAFAWYAVAGLVATVTQAMSMRTLE